MIWIAAPLLNDLIQYNTVQYLCDDITCIKQKMMSVYLFIYFFLFEHLSVTELSASNSSLCDSFALAGLGALQTNTYILHDQMRINNAVRTH